MLPGIRMRQRTYCASVHSLAVIEIELMGTTSVRVAFLHIVTVHLHVLVPHLQIRGKLLEESVSLAIPFGPALTIRVFISHVARLNDSAKVNDSDTRVDTSKLA